MPQVKAISLRVSIMTEPYIALPAPPATIRSLAMMLGAVATPATPAPLLCCLMALLEGKML